MRRSLFKAPPIRGGRDRRLRFTKRTTAATLGGIASLATAGAIVASAAVPTFPNNITVFPDRDFVSVDGYEGHGGQDALVTVTRGTQVMGAATVKVSGGEVAFEINHPGGFCWGAGTGNPQVTPDIKAGDKVTVKFDDGSTEDTTVQDANVTANSVLTGSTLTVEGHIGADVNPDFIEQRIINPDLVDTAVGKRDIRAVPGPLTPAPRGGYSSGLTVDPAAHTFKATYEFNDPAVAQIAANADLGERAMTWQVQDADGNRQGLTIAEFGEAGGPGLGGCPNGPGNVAAPSPGTAAVVRSQDKASASVSWAPATAQPGAPAVTGYSIEAIGQTATAGGNAVLGVRTGSGATSATITGLSATEAYSFEIRSITGNKSLSDPYTVAVPAPPATPGDTTLPTLSATPPPTASGVTTASSVTLTSDGQIFYTTDGSSPIDADMPSASAKLYTGPIAITGLTSLSVAAFDPVGNHRELKGDYAPDATPVTPPTAPLLGASTAGQATATLRWDASATATLYGVQLYKVANGTQTAVGGLRETPDRVMTITPLDPGNYVFTVQAKNAGGYGSPSVLSAPLTVTAVTDRVSITSAKWKTGDFRVVGTDSAWNPTVTVLIRTANTAGTGPGPVLANQGAGTVVTAPVAPATVGDYSIRLRNGSAPAGNPGKIWVTSSNGGVAGPFTVTNG